MYAVIETGGKQYRVSEGTVLKVEKLKVEAGDKITIDKVLLIGYDDGNVKIGDPTVPGAAISAEVIEQGRGKKVIVYKYKRRKNYHKKQGHRQAFTKIVVNKILSE